ncbi:DUF5753 domain-containing protein [Sphaerisporangium sp. B11E5]|uniref:DUF5753 domain-containing protein n=1 Tax=Sphaerisporangium sp. B11E5 TaxID=3153563 RepID=UPI00325DEC76
MRASVEAREVLAALTEAAFTEVYTWRTLLQGRPHNQDEIQEMESQARRILTFQSSMVPGLLQTAEYARRVLTLFQPPYDESDIPAAVAGRLDRQLALYEENRGFEFLITEAALRWRPGPPRLLRAQLDRLASISTLSNISMGLIPHAVEAVVSITHPFVLFEETGEEGHAPSTDDAGDAIVTVEAIHGPLTLQDQESVSLYRTQWSLLRRMAVFGDDARRLLAGIADEFGEIGS